MSQTPDPTQGPRPEPYEQRKEASRAAMVPPAPPPGYVPAPMYAPPAPKRAGVLNRILVSLITSVLIFSLVLNLYFGAFFATSMRGPTETVYTDGLRTKRIVILPIKGMIDDSTSVFIRQAFTALREDKPEAIVLRVDSGGGGVSASDRIWHELKRFKDETGIPIVASFGSLAASGGYYVSAPTDYIFVEPTTITGSIGVIAPAFTVHEMLHKIGVTPETIVATESTRKDVANNIMRPWNEEDREKIRHLLDFAHARFTHVVAEGRKQYLGVEDVRRLANGEVFNAQEALANKLVDEEGYLDAAIEKAKAMAKIDADVTPYVTVMQPARQFGLLNLISGSGPSVAPMAIDSDLVRRWAGELGMPRLEYSVQW